MHFMEKEINQEIVHSKKRDDKIKHLSEELSGLSEPVEEPEQDNGEDYVTLEETVTIPEGTNNVNESFTLEEMLTIPMSTESEELLSSPDEEVTSEPEISTPLEGKKKRKANRKWIPKHIYRKEKRKSLKKKVNLIHNFSSIQLTEHMRSVLNKGLNFCPSKKGVNYTELLADLFRLERKMAWKYQFHGSEEEEQRGSSSDHLKTPFDDKKKRTNLPKEYPKEITEFVHSLRSDLKGSTENKDKHSNLSKEEWEALDQLNRFQKDGKIVIQPADKNGGICILDRKDYIDEANRQLEDTLKNEEGEDLNYYAKSSEKAVKDQFKQIKKVIQEGISAGYFTEEFGKKLLPKEHKASNLYLLPKVHKQFQRIPKGRPIIAACGSNTERISWLLDSVAKESVKNLESYIEDTPDLLRYFEKVNSEESLPPNSKPFSIDIKSFYTNITLEEGVQAFRETLDQIPNKTIPTEYLVKLLKLVMGSNILKFDDEFGSNLLEPAWGQE